MRVTYYLHYEANKKLEHCLKENYMQMIDRFGRYKMNVKQKWIYDLEMIQNSGIKGVHML